MRRIKHPTDVGVVCEPKMSLLVRRLYLKLNSEGFNKA